MALNSNTLTNLIINKMEDEFGDFTKKQQRDIRKFASVMAEAVVEHFQTSADVTLSLSVTINQGGLQTIGISAVPGTPTGGPVSPISIPVSGTGNIT